MDTIRANALRDAHRIIRKAFDEQLAWWVYLPIIGVHRIARRYKLLRIGRYLCDQMQELNGGTTFAELASDHTDNEIAAKLEPWTLACAVGAANGTIYGPGQGGMLTLDLWLHCVQRKKWQSLTGVSDARTEKAIRSYVKLHRHQHMNDVLREEEARRGITPSVVLGPGESMTVTASIKKL